MGKREVAAGTAVLWCGYALERILLRVREASLLDYIGIMRRTKPLANYLLTSRLETKKYV